MLEFRGGWGVVEVDKLIIDGTYIVFSDWSCIETSEHLCKVGVFFLAHGFSLKDMVVDEAIEVVIGIVVDRVADSEMGQ